MVIAAYRRFMGTRCAPGFGRLLASIANALRSAAATRAAGSA